MTSTDNPIRKGYKPTTYRQIPGAHSSPKAFDWAQGIFRGCKQEHTECSHDQEHRGLPKRLLDLRSFDGKSVPVIGTSGVSDPTYATLSYCWGRPADEDWMSYLEGVQRTSTIFAFERLPQTLQDAVIVAKQFGFGYLWIDGLCILQHDRADWDEEGARMSEIYQGCDLMISASNCNHSAKGFLAQRMKLEDATILLPVRVDDNEQCIIYMEREELSYIIDAARGPVSSRAWCLQEQRLAPRVLHFGKFQLHYECQSGKWEERELEINLKPRNVFYASEHNVRQPQVRDIFDRELSATKPSSGVKTVSQWNAIVSDYTTRGLTNSSDKLMALAGLARKTSELLQCQYLAGIWQNELHIGLSWSMAHMSSFYQSGNHLLINGIGEPPRRATEYRAPTWSWASMDGPVTFLLETDTGTAHLVTSSIEYVDSSISHASASQYGAVTHVDLTVRAPIKRVPATMLSANTVLNPHTFLSRYTNKIGWYVEDERKTLTGQILCVKLAVHSHGFSPGMTDENMFLVVEDLGNGQYQRCGAGKILETNYFDDAEEKTITLI